MKTYILITDKKITAISDLLPFLEKLVKVTKNLVIIAEEVEGEALTTLVVNKLRGTFNALVVKAPGFGDRRKEMLEDIAILTGGTVVSEELGTKLESVELDVCGRADKVWADKENTRIIGGKGTKAKINARIEQIKSTVEESTSEFDKENFRSDLLSLPVELRSLILERQPRSSLKTERKELLTLLQLQRLRLKRELFQEEQLHFWQLAKRCYLLRLTS